MLHLANAAITRQAPQQTDGSSFYIVPMENFILMELH